MTAARADEPAVRTATRAAAPPTGGASDAAAPLAADGPATPGRNLPSFEEPVQAGASPPAWLLKTVVLSLLAMLNVLLLTARERIRQVRHA